MYSLIQISEVEIATDEYGRFNLNTLHKASDTGREKEPNRWLRLKSTEELINAINPCARSGARPIHVVNEGLSKGVFANELLAISYAGWISPEFQLKVNQVFLEYRREEVQLATSQNQALSVDVNRLEQQIKIMEEKVKRLDPDNGYRTVAAFFRRKEIYMPTEELAFFGRLASREAKKYNIRLGKVGHPMYDFVHTYPIELLEKVFEQYKQLDH